MFIDAHCHLNMDDFDADCDAVIERAQKDGVGLMIVVGYDIPSSEKAVKMAEKYNCIYAVCGVHPHDSKDATRDNLRRLRDLLQHEKVVACGEIGLDFYKNYSPRDIQQSMFLKQVDIAREANIPIMLHVRDAHDEMIGCFEKIKKETPFQDFIVHCFSGNEENARKYLFLGGVLSFSGTVTFENAKRVAEAVKVTPPEYILTETDAPFLTPHPNRGKRNEPSFVRKVTQRCADLKEFPVETMRSIVLKNCLKVFPKIKAENFPASA